MPVRCRLRPEVVSAEPANRLARRSEARVEAAPSERPLTRSLSATRSRFAAVRGCWRRRFGF